MSTLRIFQIDAFASALFRGNPAAVVPLEGEWPGDELLQAIALENNLSETAFIRPAAGDADYDLRWFTPTTEVELCGHATLASAHALFEHLGHTGDTVRFATRFSGPLIAARDGDRIAIDLPAKTRQPIETTTPLVRALGREPVESFSTGKNIMCVFDNKRAVHELDPDDAQLRALDCFGVITTAPGAGHDFVSRYFVPKAGIHEDPVTGSAHCSLVPYWADRLGRNELTAHQVSRRSGQIWCRLEGDRVRLSGHAVTYLEGTIRLPE